MVDDEFTPEEVKEKFREARNRIIDRLDEPIFPKGTKKKPLIKTALGKPSAATKS